LYAFNTQHDPRVTEVTRVHEYNQHISHDVQQQKHGAGHANQHTDDNGEPDGRDEQECRTQNKNEQRTRRDGHHDKQRAQQTASNHRVVGGKNHFGDEHMQGCTGDETLTWKKKRKEHVFV
jgi:hypothetical protein